MIKVKSKNMTYKINLKEIEENVKISMEQCMIQNNKKNRLLLTFLFMSAQLYNKIANNYNLEPISLKQLNNLDSQLGGGKKKKKKGKKHKGKTKKKKTDKNSFQKKTKKKKYKQISIINSMVSKFKLALTLLMISLASIGTTNAQVASVGMDFDDFVEQIHNTAGIGNNPLTYKEQRELTYNWELNTNDPSHTYVTGYCAVQSAVTAGLLNEPEYRQLLVNAGEVSKIDEEIKEISNYTNNPNNTNKNFERLKHYLNSGIEDSRRYPKLSIKNNKRIKKDAIHPGAMSGFSYAATLSLVIVATSFEIPGDLMGESNISKQYDIDFATQEMIDIVQQKLVEDRNFAIQKKIIKENGVISGVLIYPGHAMTVTVLPSGALVLRNADPLHLWTTGDWLSYKPPLSIDLNDESSPGFERTIYEWKKLNKNINPITRGANQFIDDYNINIKPYGANNTSILSYISKPLNWLGETTILPANTGNMPKDSLSPFLFNSLRHVKYRDIKLVGSINSPNFTPNKSLAKKTSNHNNYFQHYYDQEPKTYLAKKKYVKCKGLQNKKNLLQCINKIDEGNILSKKMGLFTLGENGGEETKLMISELKHVPPKLSELRNKSNKTREQLMRNLRKQSKIVANTKKSHTYKTAQIR